MPVDAFSQVFECFLWVVGIDVVEGDGLSKSCDAVVACLSVLVCPDAPYEERQDNLAVLLHECFERKDVSVVECAHHASRMQSRSIALVVLDGVGIGVEDVGTGEQRLADWCSALHEVVVIGIHASYHVIAKPRPEFIHQGSFLAFAEGKSRGEHHFELDMFSLEVLQYGAPKEDIIVAFHVCHDFSSSIPGPKLRCQFEVLRVEMFLQTL